MRVPVGVRDWLPDELARKRTLESTLRGVFEGWKYQEVQTPGLERYEVLEAGIGQNLSNQVFRLTDHSGSQLVLRPEMTMPIARLVSTRMREAPLPLRLSYVQPVYRYEEPQEGRMREFTQAGLELIGVADADADAESLFSAVEALDAVGLQMVRYDINHVAIVEGVLTGFGYAGDALLDVKRLIAGRNLVDLRALANAHAGAAHGEMLVRLTMSRGQEELLRSVRPFVATEAGCAGIDRLADLLARARARGLQERVWIDFSLLRSLAYYTGIVFEGYIEELGFSLLGGGRYDTVLPRFGFNAGAVGWSTSVERLLIALERRTVCGELQFA